MEEEFWDVEDRRAEGEEDSRGFVKRESKKKKVELARSHSEFGGKQGREACAADSPVLATTNTGPTRCLP